MNKADSRNKILAWLLCLFLIVMACDTSNVDPSDERLQEPVKNLAENFENYYSSLGFGFNQASPFLYYLFPNESNLTNLGKKEYKFAFEKKYFNYVSIYEVILNGCNNSYTYKNKIKTIQLITEETDTIDISFYAKPGTFVSIVGSVNELLLFSKYKNENVYLLTENDVWQPEIISPKFKTQQFSYNENLEIQVEAYPGMCLALEIDGETVGRESVDEDGQWLMTINNLPGGDHEISIIPQKISKININNYTKEFKVKPEIIKIAEEVPLYDNDKDCTQIKTYSRQDDCDINSNCTWYAAEAVKEYSGKEILMEGLGGAIKWPQSAINKDYVSSIDKIPEAGSVIYIYDQLSFPLGHVAFVESFECDFTTDPEDCTLTWSEESATDPQYGCDPYRYHNSHERVILDDDSIYRWRYTISFTINNKGEISQPNYDEIKFIHLIYE